MAVNFKLQNFDQFMNDQLKGRGSVEQTVFSTINIGDIGGDTEST